MKQNLFDIIAKQTDWITKEALLGVALTIGKTVLRGAGSLVGKAVKNPMKTMGAAFTASDLQTGTKRFGDIANRNPSNPFTRTM